MADAVKVTVGGSVLPGGITGVKRSDELLWSEGTGRSASSGKMVGSVVAEKQTYTIDWGVVTQTEYKSIRSSVGGGYLPVKIEVNGSKLADMTAYRGSISGSLLGVFGGTAYYSNVSVELVEQ